LKSEPVSDLAKLASPYEPDEFVPMRMRQQNGVFVLADRDTLIGNLNLWAGRTGWT
jgi:hypothetical protein